VKQTGRTYWLWRNEGFPCYFLRRTKTVSEIADVFDRWGHLHGGSTKRKVCTVSSCAHFDSMTLLTDSEVVSPSILLLITVFLSPSNWFVGLVLKLKLCHNRFCLRCWLAQSVVIRAEGGLQTNCDPITGRGNKSFVFFNVSIPASETRTCCAVFTAGCVSVGKEAGVYSRQLTSVWCWHKKCM
jgi:hypothetical protein